MSWPRMRWLASAQRDIASMALPATCIESTVVVLVSSIAESSLMFTGLGGRESAVVVLVSSFGESSLIFAGLGGRRCLAMCSYLDLTVTRRVNPVNKLSRRVIWHMVLGVRSRAGRR